MALQVCMSLSGAPLRFLCRLHTAHHPRSPRQETKPFCRPSWPPTCERRRQGMEEQFRKPVWSRFQRPGPPHSSWAKPHSSWDIFSDIPLLATKACLIHSHCWGCLYAANFSQHPVELCTEPRALRARDEGRSEKYQDGVSESHPDPPLKGKSSWLCGRPAQWSSLCCSFPSFPLCKHLHKGPTGPLCLRLNSSSPNYQFCDP